jgi:pyruvate/2-oxoglutarate dehydrogenase complex dihydrolipoamide acyltransferase (E2) component
MTPYRERREAGYYEPGNVERAAEEGIQATEAALQTATELGVDLTQIKGTGADGRITVGDVKTAAEK